MNLAKIYGIVSLCFFISGASALIFQVLWIRLFSLIFGTTQFAMGTVIAGFLGGLGIGSWWVSRSRLEFKQPLLVYGILECLIGVYGLIFPFLCTLLIPLQELILNVIEPGFYGFSLIRLLLTLLLLLPPTIAMGATLPILSEFCQHRLTRPLTGISLLYALNTLGASLGSLLAGLWFIPTVGVTWTNTIAVSLNFLIVGITFLLAKGVSSEKTIAKNELATNSSSGVPKSSKKGKKKKGYLKEGKKEQEHSTTKAAVNLNTSDENTVENADGSSLGILLSLVIVFSSLMTLMLELLWSRILELILGSSIYVVSAILTAFIFGLGFGSLFSSLFLVPRKSPFFWMGMVFLGAASSLFGCLYLVDEFPIWLISLFHYPLTKTAILVTPLTQFSLPTLLVFICFFSLSLLICKILHLQYREISFRYFLVLAFGLTLIVFSLFRFLMGLLRGAKGELLGDHFEIFFLTKFFIICCILLPPCLFLGMIFPLGIASLKDSVGSLRRQIGQLYFWSTIGSILGSLFGGFLLIPLVGVFPAIFSILGVAVFFSFFFLFREKPKFATVTAVLFTAFFGYLLSNYPPPLNMHILTSGVNQYIHNINPMPYAKLKKEFGLLKNPILYHKDGVTATITVIENPQDRSLKVNGKVDASSSGDMATQMLLAHVPMCLVPKQEDVLIIGYGSGMTVGSVAKHENLKKATVVEIEQEVLNASYYFDSVNGEPLKNPKVQFELNDARNFLLLKPNTYDVIISEPSNPWMTGASKLFTLEFFELVKKRLNPGGIAGIWFHLYGMDQDSLRILFNTFQQVFPHQYLFKIGSDMILIGREEPLTVSMEHLSKRLTPPVLEDLNRINVYRIADLMSYFYTDSNGLKVLAPFPIQTVQESPLKNFVSGDILLAADQEPLPLRTNWKEGLPQEFRAAVLRDSRIFQYKVKKEEFLQLKTDTLSPLINTDNLPLIEYQAPRKLYMKKEKDFWTWFFLTKGTSRLPKFLSFSSPEEEKMLLDQLLNNMLVSKQYRTVGDILASLEVSDPLFAQQSLWKLNLLQGKYEDAQNICNGLKELFYQNNVENNIFYHALLLKDKEIVAPLFQAWKTEPVWKKNPALAQGFEAFVKFDFVKSLQKLQEWDHTHPDTPLFYWLFRAIGEEQKKEIESAIPFYEKFFEVLLNQKTSLALLHHYLDYVVEQSDMPSVERKCQQLAEKVKVLQLAIKTEKGAKDDNEALRLFEKVVTLLPDSKLVWLSYYQALYEMRPGELLPFVEKHHLQELKDLELLKEIAFLYKKEGIEQNNPAFFEKSIVLYQKAMILTSKKWEKKDLQFQIDFTQKLSERLTSK